MKKTGSSTGTRRRVDEVPYDRIWWPVADSKKGKTGSGEAEWAKSMRIRFATRQEQTSQPGKWWCSYCSVCIEKGTLRDHWVNKRHTEQRRWLNWKMRINNHIEQGRIRGMIWNEGGFARMLDL